MWLWTCSAPNGSLPARFPMCGIAGYWQTPGASHEREHEQHIARMLQAIVHRGPDGQGHHIDAARGLVMGHVRLAVIDLESGHQPIFSTPGSAGGSTDGRQVITTNGEFYDYKLIRAQLLRRGHRFHTRADTEIALPLYRERGLDFVEALRGEFAIALFDAETERLILVRDRFGVRPLYYHVDGDNLYWGSEAKALFAHGAVPRVLDERAALGQMMNLMLPGRSAFAGVRQLRPGHLLIAQRDRDGRLRIETRRYWDLEFPRERAPIDPNDAIELVAERFTDAIRTRLEADVPVGCYLSGGIDSCSILAMASALQQSRVRAFTIGFDDARYDETAIAREMAESMRADQTVVPMQANELYGDAYVRAVRHAERSFYNPFGVAKLHLSRAVREAGYRVVITGEGSDELFAGYPFFKQDLVRAGDLSDASATAALADDDVFRGATLATQELHHPALERAWGFTPAWIQPWMQALVQARALLSADLRERLAHYDPVTELADALPATALEGRHILDRAQYTYAKTLHESQVLAWSGDRMDMAHAVESRPAFLDHHLAAAAVTLPPALRIRGGIEKWVLREAMREVLPETLYRRRKFAFMAPPSSADAGKRARMQALRERYLSPDAIAGLGFFDARAVDEFVARSAAQEDPAQRKRNDVILNCMLGLHVLHAELC